MFECQMPPFLRFVLCGSVEVPLILALSCSFNGDRDEWMELLMAVAAQRNDHRLLLHRQIRVAVSAGTTSSR